MLTKMISAASILPPSMHQNVELYKRVNHLCGLRETMRERLKVQSKSEDLGRVNAVIAAIQGYLQELHWFISFYESNREEFKGIQTMVFIWKSAIVHRALDTKFTRPRFTGPGAGGGRGSGGGSAGGAGNGDSDGGSGGGNAGG
ncbi:hypothetical protein H4S07_004119, partial [Coemansia furcata]